MWHTIRYGYCVNITGNNCLHVYTTICSNCLCGTQLDMDIALILLAMTVSTCTNQSKSDGASVPTPDVE